MSLQIPGFRPRCLVAVDGTGELLIEYTISRAATMGIPEGAGRPGPNQAHGLLRRRVEAGTAAPWDLIELGRSRQDLARKIPPSARPVGPLLYRLRYGREQLTRAAGGWSPSSRISPVELRELVPWAPGQSPLDAALAYLAGEIRQGTAGYRAKVNGYRGVGSTFPAWFRDRGYAKREALAAIAKARAGQRLTTRQGELVDTLFTGMVEEMREARQYYATNPPHRRRRNPPNEAQLFGRHVLSIAYEHEHDREGPMRHKFARGTGPQMYALPDGQVLIQGRRRVWNDF